MNIKYKRWERLKENDREKEENQRRKEEGETMRSKKKTDKKQNFQTNLFASHVKKDSLKTSFSVFTLQTDKSKKYKIFKSLAIFKQCSSLQYILTILIISLSQK